jgi:hypothetical protein
MLLITELAIVIFSFLFLVYAGVKAGRAARELGRAAQRFQQQAEPKSVRISRQADSARELAFHVMDRAEVLEQRGAVLTVSVERLMVLVSAAAEAKGRVDKVTGYIGL